MASTDDLIASLSGELLPVRRLRPPLIRALGWIILATVVIALLALMRGFRADMGVEMRDPAYYAQVGAAWLTGVTATVAAFEVSLPDRGRAWLLLPLPSVAIWLYGFGYGCLAHWVAIPEGAPVAHDSVRCLETIIMASVPLSLALWLMLRRSRPLRPGSTAWLAGLAVAAFADMAHLLLHVVEASLLVLLINLVPVCMIVLTGAVVGKRGLRFG